MTDEEIRKLAREYRQHASYPFEDMTEAKLTAIDVIKWLSEKFCIVEKEKVNGFWHEITTLYLNGGKITYDGARFMFRSLFSKELFNDTEK